MQAEQEHRLAEAVAASDVTKLAGAALRLERTFTRRHKQDVDLADALLRILRSALGKELRDRIKEIANEPNSFRHQPRRAR
jgi:hypothetical protein